MIDLHCHILPNVDDGPKTLEAALAMARLAVADGLNTIVCTPHYATLAKGGQRADVERRVAEFQTALDVERIPLKVLAGSELFLTPEAPRLHDAGELVTLNGSRYILVEIPFDHYPATTDETLFQLQSRGLQPLFAHPERQATIQKKPELMEALVARGVIAQVTALSLLGGNGKTVQASADLLLRRGLVHVISTDAHVADGPRKPLAAEAVRRAAALIGEARARGMVDDLPAAIIANGDYELPAPQVAEQGGGWQFWKRWTAGVGS